MEYLTKVVENAISIAFLGGGGLIAFLVLLALLWKWCVNATHRHGWRWHYIDKTPKEEACRHAWRVLQHSDKGQVLKYVQKQVRAKPDRCDLAGVMANARQTFGTGWSNAVCVRCGAIDDELNQVEIDAVRIAKELGEIKAKAYRAIRKSREAAQC